MASNNPENIANEVFDNTPEIYENKNQISEDESQISEDKSEDESEVSEDEVSEDEVSEDEVSEDEVSEGEVSENEVSEDEVSEDEVSEDKEEIINIENNQTEKESTFNVAKNNAVQVINNLLENINSGLININSIFSKKNKKLNKINGNIQDMLTYQDNLYEDDKYVEYLNYLKLFYELDNKKTIYKKSYENNKLILTSKDKRIVITPSIVIDLDNYKLYLQKEIHNILFNILQLIENYSSNNETKKNEFNKYKNSYILFKSQLNDIENIEVNYFNKIIKLEEDIVNLSTQLNILKDERVSVYQKINSKINNQTKEQFIISFKENNNKIPPPDVIQKISSDTQINIEQIELWLQWIEKSYLYLNGEQKYTQLVKEKYIEEENFKNLTKNFILQKPNIEFS
jgi:hypothetical protein